MMPDEYLEHCAKNVADFRRRGVNSEEAALEIATNVNAMHLLTYIEYHLSMCYLRGYSEAGGDFAALGKGSGERERRAK